MTQHVKVFQESDFENVGEKFQSIKYASKELAAHCNKLLSERLVKYYCKYATGTKDVLYVSPTQQGADTHFILGLEPEPIVREPVKVSVDRDKLWCLLQHHVSNKEFLLIAERLGL